MSTSISIVRENLDEIGGVAASHLGVIQSLAVKDNFEQFQKSGKAVEHYFPVISAAEFGGDSGANITDSYSEIATRACVREFGTSLALGDLDTMNLGSKETLKAKIGAAVGQAVVNTVLSADATRLNPTIVASLSNNALEETLLEVGGDLNDEWGTSEVCLMDSWTYSKLFAKNGSEQPISDGDKSQYGIGYEGKWKGFEKLYRMPLKKVNGIATTVAATIKVPATGKEFGEVVFGSDCGFDKGNLVLVAKGGKNYVVEVTDDDGTKGRCYDDTIATQITGLAGTGSATYSQVMMWGENCRVYGFATKNYTKTADTTIYNAEDGMPMVCRIENDGDNLGNIVKIATALAARIADKSKAGLVLVKHP